MNSCKQIRNKINTEQFKILRKNFGKKDEIVEIVEERLNNKKHNEMKSEMFFFNFF